MHQAQLRPEFVCQRSREFCSGGRFRRKVGCENNLAEFDFFGSNRVEAVIRAYDPCLSCSTHTVGQMALNVQPLNSEGTILDERS